MHPLYFVCPTNLVAITHSHPTNIQNNQTPCTTYSLKNPHNQNFYNLIVGVYHYETNKSRALSYQPPCTKIVEPYLCSLIPDGGRVFGFYSAKINCFLLLINESPHHAAGCFVDFG